MRDPADLLTCPECGAGLDHAQAACASCDFEPLDTTPREDGPDAADLWERHQPTPVIDLVFFGACIAVGVLGLAFGPEAVGILLNGWAWLLEVL